MILWLFCFGVLVCSTLISIFVLLDCCQMVLLNERFLLCWKVNSVETFVIPYMVNIKSHFNPYSKHENHGVDL